MVRYERGNSTSRRCPRLSTTLRYWEYYDMQDIFDELYEESNQGKSFSKLYDIIISENNILLAYRTIKSNKGSKTAGTDGFIINDYKTMEKGTFIEHVRNELGNYKPKAVRRVLIPKPNGDKRPLGIPTMFDRLIQQMIKQIIEPICEAKFYKHSYGFRPLRSAHHALARAKFLVNRNKLHFTVDIDIKGFFDNVNHSLLLKQLWNIGIRDKVLLAIIYKILKAPIKGLGVPEKGTPQGGILSPLLSNVVLNDLDQWIAGQWENFSTKRTYAYNHSKCNALRDTSTMKEGFIVRYADDFKVFARTHETATKWYKAIKLYLKDRLKLDISTEKSKIINLRKKKSDFLGFTIHACKKSNKWVCKSNILTKKLLDIKIKARERIKVIQKSPTAQNVLLYNAFVLGIHNYFKYATNVNVNMNRLAYDLSKTLYNRLKPVSKYESPNNSPPTFKRFYKNNFKTYKIGILYLFPFADIGMSIAKSFVSRKCIYTPEGRKLLHQQLAGHMTYEIHKLLTSYIPNGTMEYLDNRISRYSMKMGKCEITDTFLSANEVHCHHYLPKSIGGTDEFKNLRILSVAVHRLIHATTEQTINEYLSELRLDTGQINKVNQYRKACNLMEIS